MKLVLLEGKINTNNPTKGREDSSEEMGPGGNWREGAPGRAPEAEKVRHFGQTKKASVVGSQVMRGNEKQRWKGRRSGKTLWDGNISEFYPKYKEMVMIFLLFIFFLPEDRRMAPPPGICVGERSEIWQEMRKESINKVFLIL